MRLRCDLDVCISQPPSDFIQHSETHCVNISCEAPFTGRKRTSRRFSSYFCICVWHGTSTMRLLSLLCVYYAYALLFVSRYMYGLYTQMNDLMHIHDLYQRLQESKFRNFLRSGVVIVPIIWRLMLLICIGIPGCGLADSHLLCWSLVKQFILLRPCSQDLCDSWRCPFLIFALGSGNR